jgi:hypothetical protein
MERSLLTVNAARCSFSKHSHDWFSHHGLAAEHARVSARRHDENVTGI